MINILHGEFIKILRNRLITIFTVGMLPLLTITLLSVLAITTWTGTLSEKWGDINWHQQIILSLLVSNNIIGQALFIIFAATIFGGEGSWNTWKAIVPRSKRYYLILSKFIVTATGILVAINGVALMTFIGSWMIALAAEKPFMGGAWADVTVPFFTQYTVALLAIFSSMMIGAIFAAFASVMTNSISGGMLGLIASIVDASSLVMLTLASILLGNDFPLQIAKLMPSFNVQNLLAWMIEGQGIDGRAFWFSGLILAVWIFGGITLTMVLFIRRDID